MMLDEGQRWALLDRLRQKPFSCDRVYFLECPEGGAFVGIDSKSRDWLSSAPEAVVDTLTRPVTELTPAALTDCECAESVSYFLAVPHGRLRLVLVKSLQGQKGDHEAPFNEYVPPQVSLLLDSVIGPSEAWERREPADDETETGRKRGRLRRFRELDEYRECRELWRGKYGPSVWLAVKSGRGVVAHAESEKKLQRQLDAVEDLEPPILIVPPEEGEEIARVESTGQYGRSVGGRQVDGVDGTVRQPTLLQRVLQVRRRKRP